jgi:hypothetical protein
VFANWADIMQLLLQLSQQQQQPLPRQQWQQHSAVLQRITRAQLRMLEIMHQLFCLWTAVVPRAPSAVPPAVVETALLLLRVPQCGLLWTGAAAAAAAAALPVALGCSNIEALQETYCKMQINAGTFLYQLCRIFVQEELATAAAGQTVTLLREPAVTELLLQMLTVHTMLLHQHLSKEQQQQQPSESSKQQLRADLLPIPAFHQHQDMLQLLPGGQAYLDVMHGLSAAACNNSASELWQYSLYWARAFCNALEVSLQKICMQDSTTVDCNAPVLSAAAVRLVLELQLLAAGAVQRQRQRKRSRSHSHRCNSSSSSSSRMRVATHFTCC